MNYIGGQEQQEVDYLDAVRKAYDLRKSINKLTLENQKRFFRELTGTIVNEEIIKHVLSMLQGGDNR